METTNYRSEGNDLDLAQFEDRFESAAVEQRKYEEPPDGKYQVVVDRVELARSQTSGNLMLKWQLKILGPKCVGRYLFRNNMIATADNLKWLKTDLATCGMDVNTLKLSDLPNRLGELLDLTLEVQKKNNGQYTNVYLQRRIQVDVPPGFTGDRQGAQDDMPF